MLAKNETTHEDMIDILEEYKKYAPSKDDELDELIPTVDTTCLLHMQEKHNTLGEVQI